MCLRKSVHIMRGFCLFGSMLFFVLRANRCSVQMFIFSWFHGERRGEGGLGLTLIRWPMTVFELTYIYTMFVSDANVFWFLSAALTFNFMKLPIIIMNFPHSFSPSDYSTSVVAAIFFQFLLSLECPTNIAIMHEQVIEAKNHTFILNLLSHFN